MQCMQQIIINWRFTHAPSTDAWPEQTKKKNPAQDLTEQTSKWLKEVSLSSYNKNKMERPKNKTKQKKISFNF